MPWSTPTLRDVRTLVRDNIRASLPGSDATIANSVLRVLSDTQGALCHLTLQYIDWLALQLLPDTAEAEWLDRHGQIWLVNADGTVGRKQATLASGSATATGTPGIVIPAGSLLGSSNGVDYETMDLIIIGDLPTPVNIRALDAGIQGNQVEGSFLAWAAALDGVDGTVTVIEMDGGTDTETDDELRYRVLTRIRQPPMGGDQKDYVQWALAVPGVTRAWCQPNGLGIGTIIVRFLMDDLRPPDGWPTYNDVQAVTAYMNTVRPVAVKDFYVEAPIKQPIEFIISELNPDSDDVRSQIEASIRDMLFQLAQPGQTIFAAWKNFAVLSAPSVLSFRLVNNIDDIMTAPGYMAVLGDIVYVP
jgi:uncharacterized phage protein gp47/JayE